MKARACLTVEQLDTLRDLPAGDPLRTHAGECPRCRALVESYELFLSPGPEAQAPHALAADARLSAALEQIVGRAPNARPGGSSWWQRFFSPGLRPAWTLAAVAILAGSVYLAVNRQGSGPEVLRGTAVNESRGSGIAIVRAVRSPDGGVELTWRRHPEAESYLVRFFSSDLSEVGHLGPVPDTMLSATAAQVPFLGEPGGTVLFRVHASAHGDEIATSRARALDQPLR